MHFVFYFDILGYNFFFVFPYCVYILVVDIGNKNIKHYLFLIWIYEKQLDLLIVNFYFKFF